MKIKHDKQTVNQQRLPLDITSKPASTFYMKSRSLNKEAQSEDVAGNNIALTCPACGKVYIVSEFLHGGERSCPKCSKSKGLVKGVTAQIIWDL